MDSFLTRAGNLTFPSNRVLLTAPDSETIRVVRRPSGHFIAYGPHGRRLLATDPSGHPLHECGWGAAADGSLQLVRARVWLDWGQWVGIKPRGLVNQTVLDLSRKPGWQRLTANDLRELAARALGVPFDEVKFFYTDEDLVIDAKGLATIRHAKDALYVLEEDTFQASPQHIRFMACMGAMHWADIDFLPVVELFQSLLPGTGSAVFELIRGLYDDQNEGRPARPLRYRGVPPYPSEAAYKLFSSFFVPYGATGVEPFSIFMDARRSHEVTWLPVPDPPQRYVDEEQGLCVTVQEGFVQKATRPADPAGLAFLPPGPRGFVPGGRSVTIKEGQLVLSDGGGRQGFSIRPEWNLVMGASTTLVGSFDPDWRTVFEPSMPHVDPRDAYGAVLLYPEDGLISELATQPLVADYVEDVLESATELTTSLTRAEQILIDGFDAALAAYLRVDRPRTFRVLYTSGAFAQKQAQMLWNRLAKSNRLSWLQKIHFVEGQGGRQAAYADAYDVIYLWTPFHDWSNRSAWTVLARRLASALKVGGVAFVAGPAELESMLGNVGLRCEMSEPVEGMPTLAMLRSILPRAQVKPGLTLFEVKRG